MAYFKCAATTLVLLCCCFNVSAQERSAADFLNEALAKKPLITVSTTVWKARQKCRRLPKSADGGVACEEEKYQETSTSQTPASVTSTTVVKVNNLKFDTAKIVSLPGRAMVDFKEYSNCDDVQLTTSVTVGVSGTRSWSVSKTEGVSTTTGGSATLTGSAQYGSASVSLNYSHTINTSTTESESFSEAASRTATDSVSVGPKKVGRFSIIAYQMAMDIPFSGEVIVDGPIRENTSGIQRASDLLSERERTMPLRGVLHSTDVSAAKVKTESLPFAPECQSDKRSDAALVMNEHRFDAPDKAVSARFLTGFVAQGKIARDSKNIVSSAMSNVAAQIGQPDGTSYEILYSTETVHPDPRCGINDLGIANLAIFNVEHRIYRTYVNGKEVAVWASDNEVYRKCAPAF